MERVAVIGSQWGDEGKGKVVDFLADGKDIVARYSGGPNAGHTIVINDKQFILHLIPSGIFRKDTVCVMGNGMAVDPESLIAEIEGLEKEGVYVGDNLLISESAHVIMPYNRLLDSLNEKIKGEKQIGTTRKGIGPTYADKASRVGLRMGDLLREEVLKEKLEFILRIKNLLIKEFFGEKGFDFNELFEKALSWGERLKPYIANTTAYMKKAIKEGKSILYEGAQGTMLDIDHGTYPYVTSSNPTIGGIMTGLGVPPSAISEVVAVVKAYTTRVGGGAFPTEDKGEFGVMLREKGGEYGATTGRPRRCGWLDLVVLKYAAWLNGFSKVAITKLDVLDGFEKIKVCVAYEIDGERTEEFPLHYADLLKAKPVYIEFPGWKKPVKGVRKREDLPKEAMEYINYIAEAIEAELLLVSTGANRDHTVTFC